MPIRITGMNSGLDTESIITQLASARSVKVNSIKKAQIKQSWKTEAWASLNSKVMKFYNETLTDMQYVSSYSKKASTVSDSSVASVLAGTNSVIGTQTLSVKSLATSGYLTGAKVTKNGGGTVKSSTKLSELGVDGKSSITISTKSGEKTIQLTPDMTVAGFNEILQKNGLNASLDEKQQRFYISSKETGKDSDFTIIAADANGLNALEKLGLNAASDATKEAYKKAYDKSRGEMTGRSREEYIASVVTADEIDKYNSSMDVLDLYPAGSEPEKPEAFKWKEPTDSLKKGENGKYQINGEEYDSIDEAKEDYKVKKQLNDMEWDFYNEYTEAKAFVDSIDLKKEQAGLAYDKLSTSDFDSYYASVTRNDGLKKIDGQNSAITLNGVEYESNKNVFEINGLTITVNNLTTDESGVDKPVTIKTEEDYSGIYDMVKNFIGKYNELINEMDKLYNADAAKGYDPLLSEEKAELKDSEIEEWEKKVKDSLLRRDGTLYDVKSTLTSIMLQTREVNGQKLSLSSFGVNTLGYFNAAENEKNAYHIYGDKDDSTVSGKDDQLMQMIQTDPEAVAGFFSDLAKNMRDSLFNKMKATEFSSSFTLYEDKLMKSEYCDYTKRVTKAESALNDYIDKWYDKFAQMEAAMAKVNDKQTSLSGLFGG